MTVLDAAKRALDKKAEGLLIFDISKVSSIADHVLMCSADNERQIRAIADHIRSYAKGELIGSEGWEEANWIILDFGDFICHIISEEYRLKYHLEEIYQEGKTVKIPEDFFLSA